MWVTFDGILLTHCKLENDHVIRPGRLCVVILGSYICYWARKQNSHLETNRSISWEASPVTSSRISRSVVLRSSLTSAGMPPQFFSAILLSSLAFPYTKFLRAPQALRWTSVIRWSSRSTRSCMPPCLLIWKSKGNSFGLGESSSIVWAQELFSSENPLPTTALTELGLGRGKKTS